MRTLRALQRVPPGLALAILAIGVVLWPGWTTPAAALIGDEGLEAYPHAWGMMWFVDALTSLRPPWGAPDLAWPRGGVLWYIDPIGAWLTAPAQVLFGPAVAYNQVLALQVGLAAWAGFAYGEELGGRGAGWVAGAALATAPWFVGELHNGIVEAGWIGLVPLAGLAAARGWAGTGLFVGLAAIATLYHGVSAAVLVGAHMLSKGRIKLLAQTALLSALIALPVYGLISASMKHPLALADKAPMEMNLAVLRINATDPIALFKPGDFWTVHFEAPLNPPFKRTPYLGWGVMALALVGLIRRPRQALLLLPVAIGVTFCLGPYLWRGVDFARDPNGSLVTLPFRWVLWLSGANIEHPLRFVGMALVALGGLAGAGAAGRLAPIFAIAIAIEHLTFAPNAWPLPTTDASLPEVYGAIPDDGRAIVDLPADRGISMATSRYVYWHGMHGHPIPYTSKVSSESYPSMNAALRTWTAVGRMFELPPGTPGAPDPNADLAAAVRELADQGFGWVVLHKDLMAWDHLEADHRQAINPLLGEPEEIGGALLWEIPAPSGAR